MNLQEEPWPSLKVRVQALYEQPPRAYHSWQHVEACLGELARVRDLCQNPLAVELAIWFHDGIYDVHRHDNEEASAQLARQWLGELHLPQPLINEVARLILATRHDAAPDWADGKLMVDIDLAILGQEPARFDAYERAIRQEYAHVPEAAFREGRAKILRRFLDRPRIYLTEPFHRRYEAAATANLLRSISHA